LRHFLTYIFFILSSCYGKSNQIIPIGFMGNNSAGSGAVILFLAAEAVTFGLTAAGSVGAGNIDVVRHTGLRLVVRALLHAAGYGRFGVAVAF
jgi:hypothetical protein